MFIYRIYTDATADIPEKLKKRYSIRMLGIPVIVGDEAAKKIGCPPLFDFQAGLVYEIKEDA